jgi:hypothetical protein
MYKDYLKEFFPHDEENGFYKAPKLPAVKLGKALMSDTRIASPNDVVAMYFENSIFGSEMVIFTEDTCYFEEGAFLYEDIKEVQQKERRLTIFINQKGQFLPNEMKVKNEKVAYSLRKVLEGLGNYDPKAEELVEKVYDGYSNTELDWLNLRDEIMRTIDMLYARYNDGKLSMMEYEEKKTELLARL